LKTRFNGHLNPSVGKTVTFFGDSLTTYTVFMDGVVKNNKTGRLMKSHRDGSGYLYYSLTHSGKVNKLRIHTLLFRTFVNSSYDRSKFVVDHVSCDKEDNSLYNLQLVTYSDNTKNYYGLSDDCAKFRNQNIARQRSADTRQRKKDYAMRVQMNIVEEVVHKFSDG